MNQPSAPKSPHHPYNMDGSKGTASRPSHPGTFFIGRYRVVDEIGVGGMASVHLARMDGPGQFQKWVAIKRIHPDLVKDEQVVKMFLDEARIAASISHPHVAQVFDLGSHEDTHWIAMEYLHGDPVREILRHVMDKGQVLSPPLAARIIADAAEGLHSAHELRGKDGHCLNLIHRDVTPHNLFLTYDGVVKVVDFGIAKVTGSLSTTQTGKLKGKTAYMAPEQIGGRPIDRRVDIFALGVILWELTTGRRLFRRRTESATVERVHHCVVPPPSTIVHHYPVELESIVMCALRKHPDDRYQTARDLSRALQQYLMHAGRVVGPEELAAYVQNLFRDRIADRDAHLKWAAHVTKTLSLAQFQPATEAAGLDAASAQHELQGQASIFEGLTYGEDDGETIVEPFRADLMRQELIKHENQHPPPSGPQRPVAPLSAASASDSRDLVPSLKQGPVTDETITRPMFPGKGQSAPTVQDFVNDEDHIETIVCDASRLLNDRLIAKLPPEKYLARAQVEASPPPRSEAHASGYVPPGLAPSDAAFDETQWAKGLRGGSPIIVYGAAALVGFLIVAVLIAVLLGGPRPSPFTPVPAPAPSST